jgi:hypothetical protein
MICMMKWSADSPSGSFDIEFMAWEPFFNAVMQPGDHSGVLRHLSEADLVIGGIDMTISYL